MNMFVALNGHSLRAASDDAVDTMLAVGGGDLDEAAVSAWLATRLINAD